MSRAEWLNKMIQAMKATPEGAERLARAEEMGYDTSQVWLHGSSRSDIGKEAVGNFKANDGIYGKGAYFTKDPEYVEDFSMKKNERHLDAKNMAENPNSPWNASDSGPNYNAEWGQTTYPVFLKKSDINIIRGEFDEKLKQSLLNETKNFKNPPDYLIEDIKKSQDNYNLFETARGMFFGEDMSRVLTDNNINRVDLPHEAVMVVNPEENVKSVFAQFKDSKGLMSGVAPAAGFINENVDQNPLSTLRNLYNQYKGVQEDFVEPAANRLADDLSFNQESPYKETIKGVVTDSMDPLNYLEGPIGAGLTIMDLLRERK